MHNSALTILAGRVRALRAAKGWTRERLADVSGVSLRYVAELEGGHANISVLRLAEVAEALGVSLVTLLAGTGPVRDEAEELAALGGEARARALAAARTPRKIALVGLRGAGKSAVGRALAERLAVPFVEVDRAVEEAAGLRLGEIFEYHGAARYRELEREALARLLAGPGAAVLATGGSVVTDPVGWELLRRGARTVWLRASPESHLARVEAQGDFRPMRGRDDALAELKGILAAREPLYAQAEVHADTEGREPAAVAGALAAKLG
ncbi:MAG: shikimate kinase [Myxococcota bacterium]